MRAQSARVLRNNRDYDSFDDYDRASTIFVKPIDDIASKPPHSQSSTTSTAAFGLLLLAGVLATTFGFSDKGRSSVAAGSLSPGPVESLRRTIRAYSTIKLEDDFKSGLGSWVSAGSAGSSSSGREWSFKNGFVRSAKLRLWKDSLGMSDYQLEFAGEIEQKGLGWAYRARDVRNYYANKIVITKPGPLPSANLIRYAVINGVEQGRAATPLRMTLRRDTLYRVQMFVKGADFSTIVNGQMVDSWSDNRLRAGGIGFFAESGEQASLRYVQVTDKDTVLGRLLSHLGFLRPITPSL
jgi:hypothetical protein